MSKTLILISSFNICTKALLFKSDCKSSMLIYYMSIVLTTFDCKPFMLMCFSFVVLIRFDFKPSMLFFYIFSILTKIDCKPSMLMSCTFIVLIRYNCNPSMTTYCTDLLLFTLSLKVFELEPNLSKKCWNAINFIFSREYMVKKLICNKEKLWILLKFAEMLMNVLKCFWRENVCT